MGRPDKVWKRPWSWGAWSPPHRMEVGVGLQGSGQVGKTRGARLLPSLPCFQVGGVGLRVPIWAVLEGELGAASSPLPRPLCVSRL